MEVTTTGLGTDRADQAGCCYQEALRAGLFYFFIFSKMFAYYQKWKGSDLPTQSPRINILTSFA